MLVDLTSLLQYITSFVVLVWELVALCSFLDRAENSPTEQELQGLLLRRNFLPARLETNPSTVPCSSTLAFGKQ